MADSGQEHWERVQVLRELVTLRKRVAELESALREGTALGSEDSEKKFRLIFEQANDAFFLEDRDERLVDVNRRACRLTGYTREELLSKKLADLESPDKSEGSPHQEYLSSGMHADASFENVILHRTGQPIVVEVNIATLRLGKEDLFLSVMRDITERKRTEELLTRLALYDPLTGLYNRNSLEEILRKEESRSRRYERPIGFLMIDVDRFKEINDTQGHHIGDAVLREISKLLKAIVRASDVVIRLGGDEFLVILPETAIEADVVRTRIERGVEFWNRTQKLTPFPVTLSIGSSYWTAQGLETVEDAMSRADAQMYARKRKAKKAARAADDGE